MSALDILVRSENLEAADMTTTTQINSSVKQAEERNFHDNVSERFQL